MTAPSIPEGMTAERLRFVALTLDTLTAAIPPPDQMRLQDALRGLEAASVGPDASHFGYAEISVDSDKVDPQASLASDRKLASVWERWLRGDSQQNDLRRWADEIETGGAP